MYAPPGFKPKHEVKATINYALKNPRYVAAGLKGSARGYQRYGRNVYAELGPIMERIAGELDPWPLELAVVLQYEQRKASRKARAALFKLLRISR